LGVPEKVGNSSVFAGTAVEVMKGAGRGKNGHIAFKVNSMERAVFHLEARGFAFDESSFKRDAKGKLTVGYLKDEIGGFAVHFVCK